MAHGVEFNSQIGFQHLTNYCTENKSRLWRDIGTVTKWTQLFLQSIGRSSTNLDPFYAGASLVNQGFSLTDTISGVNNTCNSLGGWKSRRLSDNGQFIGLQKIFTDLFGSIASSLELVEFVHMIKVVDLTRVLPEIKVGAAGFSAVVCISLVYDDFRAVFIDPLILSNAHARACISMRYAEVLEGSSSCIKSNNLWKLAQDVSKLALCVLELSTYCVAKLAFPPVISLSLSTIGLISGFYIFGHDANIHRYLDEVALRVD